ncbi:MAG: hypothetical protein IJW21_04595, partial [Clostridia bacterium]|nr:hypothetical protein [Clostridia bacterium]
MRSIIQELWHGNICPQTDSRNNSPEIKELMEYMARHHDDLLKTMADEQKRLMNSLINKNFLERTVHKKELTSDSRLSISS